MAEDWLESSIPGLLSRTLQVHADDRGSFAELWRASWTGGLDVGAFRQANLSRSQARVLRGMHFHRRQADLWVVINGRAFVVVADLRPLLEEGRSRTPVETRELAPGAALLIPSLVAHGFYAVEALDLVYLVTQEFDASDELGFAWDDPEAGIEWPDRSPILSGRDRSNPSLRKVLASLRQAGHNDSA
jgi:dTDP-4-dehydrorhamnose 3,5-epimerase